MKAYALTDIGKVRSVNEDSFYLPKSGEEFIAVADGMGGHLAGEVASKLAIAVLKKILRKAKKPSMDAFQGAFEEANRAIYEHSRADRKTRGMGTTLTAVWFDEKTAHLSHVGDSRAYLMRNGALIQLSTDHTLVNELVARGEITATEARIHPQRNLITRALGTAKRVVVDSLCLDRQPGDVWLLCSDGLSNYLLSADLIEVLQSEKPGQEMLREMIDLALERGGADNITAVLAVDEEAAL